jgi:hypothetical protein
MSEQDVNQPPSLWQGLDPELKEGLAILERTLAAVDQRKAAKQELMQKLLDGIETVNKEYAALKLQPEEETRFTEQLNRAGELLRDPERRAELEAVFRWLSTQRARESYRRYLRDIHDEERQERREVAERGPLLRLNLALIEWHLGVLADDVQLLRDARDDTAGHLEQLEEDVRRATRLLRLVANTAEGEHP